MKRKLFSLLLLCAVCETTFAQFSASFETNSTYYTKDSEQSATANEKDYGTNDYLTLSYGLGDWKAGLQVEMYKPALRGYSTELDGYMLAMKYLTWQKNGLSVTAGDFFEQFGSGIAFRSWEDRELGINNSIEGGKIEYNNQIVHIKGIVGRPRLFMHHESVRIAGGDVNLSLSDLMKMKGTTLQLEGAYINKHESLTEDYKKLMNSANTNIYSVGLNAGHKGLYGKFEYVYKDKDLYYDKSITDYRQTDGNAQLLETSYHTKGLSISLSLRRLERMSTQLTRYKTATENVFNYLPALTRQYTYSIANLNPYIAQGNGEKGGEFDLFVHSNNGWKYHTNLSTYFGLKNSSLYFLDANMDVEKKWNKSLKTIFLYSFQNNKIENPSSSHIFLADLLYKFDTKRALRFETGYLHSEGYEKDWLSALAELTFAPTWAFYVSDLYNSGTTNKHYYRFGTSFTKSKVRIDLSYGHNRAGYVCSGGVCRYSPEYTGLNLSANITI